MFLRQAVSRPKTTSHSAQISHSVDHGNNVLPTLGPRLFLEVDAQVLARRNIMEAMRTPHIPSRSIVKRAALKSTDCSI